MMSDKYIIISIAIMAGITLALRVTPFLIFSNGKETPKTVTYLGNVLPYAIIGMLVVYCLKDVSIFSGSHGIPELLAVALVCGLHIWKKNTLLSVGAGTVFYMLLVQFVFV